MDENPTSIASLCDHKAWKSGYPYRKLYLPFGIAIAISRIVFITLICTTSWLFPAAVKRFVFKILLWVLGIRLHYNLSLNDIGERTQGCVVAANHVSVFDPLTVLALPHATIMVGNPLRKTNIISILSHFSALKCSGAGFWYVTEKKEFVRRIARWRAHPQGVALYTTPEMTINNGRGLFRFNTTFVCLGMPVIPATLKLSTPLGLNPHPVNSSGIGIFFRLLMMPCLRYEVTYLDRLERRDGESKEMFSRRVQQAVAAHLGIPPSSWTAEDKHAYRAELKKAHG
ncbi:lysophospholipid acyltransferase family protein [Castellaniella sp. WN]